MGNGLRHLDTHAFKYVVTGCMRKQNAEGRERDEVGKERKEDGRERHEGGRERDEEGGGRDAIGREDEEISHTRHNRTIAITNPMQG